MTVRPETFGRLSIDRLREIYALENWLAGR